jgi:hypothetical protein
MFVGKSPGKSVSLLAQGSSALQNKESNKLFAKMGNDIINGSIERKENNFMQSTPNGLYSTESKKLTLSDQKAVLVKPQEICI